MQHWSLRDQQQIYAIAMRLHHAGDQRGAEHFTKLANEMEIIELYGFERGAPFEMQTVKMRASDAAAELGIAWPKGKSTSRPGGSQWDHHPYRGVLRFTRREDRAKCIQEMEEERRERELQEWRMKICAVLWNAAEPERCPLPSVRPGDVYFERGTYSVLDSLDSWFGPHNH